MHADGTRLTAPITKPHENQQRNERRREEKERMNAVPKKRSTYEGMRHTVPNGSTPTYDSALTVAQVSGGSRYPNILP